MTTARRAAHDKVAARRSPGRPAVPLDRIVAVALRIVDEEGADALSMRTLARQLKSSTATLYRHFANRGELIDDVIDHMFGEVDLNTEELAVMGWQQACRTVARTMFDTLTRHKNVAPLLVDHLPTGPNAMATRERCLAVLLHNGFPPPLAARSYATLARHVLGFAIQAESATRPHEDAQLATLFRGLDAADFPATIAVAAFLPVPLEQEFAFGLDLIINGLGQLSGT